MTVHYPVGLQSRFNTHRIVDAKGQIIARTEMGPATAVELRDALNHWAVVKAAQAKKVTVTNQIIVDAAGNWVSLEEAARLINEHAKLKAALERLVLFTKPSKRNALALSAAHEALGGRVS